MRTTTAAARTCALFCLLGLSLTGCTSTTVIDARTTPAKTVGGAFAEQQPMDIGVAVFGTNRPRTARSVESDLMDPNVRYAEARYFAYTLRNTLEATENWGAVRIAPRDSLATDLKVYGDVIESNGIELRLHLKAVDATGDVWVDKTYDDVASQLSYRDEVGAGAEPFQDIYNRFADDLLAAYLARDPADIVRIRKTSLLAFAEDVAPYAFEGYMSGRDDGTRVIERLPANDDPMLGRVQKIREREYMFVDLLDEHYKTMHRNLHEPYLDWRRASYQELLALRDVRRGALGAKLMGGGTALGGIVVQKQSVSRAGQVAGRAGVLTGARTVIGGIQMASESQMHVEALRELSDSLTSQVDPMVVELEDKAVTLTGTAEEQYAQWRALLRAIYEQETGINLGDDDIEPALPSPRAQASEAP
ncbi:MAG: hypothetical protein AAFU65_11510 [Pseudomonadota bacterium]